MFHLTLIISASYGRQLAEGSVRQAHVFFNSALFSLTSGKNSDVFIFQPLKYYLKASKKPHLYFKLLTFSLAIVFRFWVFLFIFFRFFLNFVLIGILWKE